jgi:hypothetical protein
VPPRERGAARELGQHARLERARSAAERLRAERAVDEDFEGIAGIFRREIHGGQSGRLSC